MAGGTLASLLILLGMDTTGVTAGSAKASSSLASMSAGATKAFSPIGLGATAAGVAVGVFAASSVKAAIDFDKSFTRIAAISNTSTDALEGMKSQVMSLAGETAQAPKELADALFFLASAGLDAEDVMPALEASAKASAVGLGETADVANIVASALNAYSDSGLTAAAATDVLVAAVREGRAEPEEFANALGRILPIASTVGVTFDQVAASMASLSNIGLDVNEGVTAMRGVLQAIAAPGSQAAEAMSQLGLSAQDLLDVISEDGIIGALRLLDKAAKAGTSTQADYNNILRQIVPNVRALTGVFGLTVQEASKVNAIFDAVKNSTGALSDAFRTTAESDSFKLRKSLNDIQIAGQQLATSALPGLVDIFQTLSPVLLTIAKNAGLFLAVLIAFKVGSAAAAAGATAFGAALGPIAGIIVGAVMAGQALNDTFYGTDQTVGELASSLTGKLEPALDAGIISATQYAAAAKAMHDPTLSNVEALFVVQKALYDAARAQEIETASKESAMGAATSYVAGLNAQAAANGNVAQQQRVAAAATDAHTQAMRDQQSVMLALQGGFLGIVGAANQLQVAQAEVTRLQQHGKRGTEEYRQATLGVLQAGLQLKQNLLDQATAMDGAGKSNAQIIGKIKSLGHEFGLSAGDVRDLIGDVKGLIGNLDKVPRNVDVDVDANTAPAMSEIVALQNSLHQLTADHWDVIIDAHTTGGSTAFHLIDMLTAALVELTTTKWDVDIHALGTHELDQLKAYRRDLDGLQNQYEKLKTAADAFKDAVRSGFEGFSDLAGGLGQMLQDFADATAEFQKATEEGTLEAGAVAPEAPDLSAFIATQVAATQQFANSLTELQKAGLSQAGLEQIAAMGPAGQAVADELLGNLPLLEQFNKATQDIANITEREANRLTKGEFGHKFERLGNDLDKLLRQLTQFTEGLDVPKLTDKSRDFIHSLEQMTKALDAAVAGSNAGGNGNNNGNAGGNGGDGTNAAPGNGATAGPQTTLHDIHEDLQVLRAPQRIEIAFRPGAEMALRHLIMQIIGEMNLFKAPL